MPDIITEELRGLRAAFRRHDREIMLVGGAVRALLLGEQPSDIDLCTDADPDEQQAIYEAEHVKHFPTGVKHGTWTVLLPERAVIEITSLRTESEHDGRHATMIWTRDWQKDLARRDLTINAMAMSFDGDLLDPFGGQVDLQQRVVRFVGEPAQRIHEDYLRILRFFRFHAMIAGMRDYDRPTLAAIQATMSGLSSISRERVWAEIAKIISGPYGIKTLRDIIGLGIAPFIDLPELPGPLLRDDLATNDPVSLMAAYLGSKVAVLTQAAAWRWSVADREQASFIVSLLTSHPNLTLRQAQTLVVRGVMSYWIEEGLRLRGKNSDADTLATWKVPDFPILGRDLLDYGIAEGTEIGQVLRTLRDLWNQSDFRLDKMALLELIPTVRQYESDLPSDRHA